MESLDVSQITGEDFDKLVSFVFRPNTDLHSWFTPIDFMGAMLRLYQPERCPCGLFAVLCSTPVL
jgi:hypothetical protein